MESEIPYLTEDSGWSWKEGKKGETLNRAQVLLVLLQFNKFLLSTCYMQSIVLAPQLKRGPQEDSTATQLRVHSTM